MEGSRPRCRDLSRPTWCSPHFRIGDTTTVSCHIHYFIQVRCSFFHVKVVMVFTIDIRLIERLLSISHLSNSGPVYVFVVRFFFFFYGGSLMDVASLTARRNSPLSSACLPASTVENPIHSPMSCVHLLLGLPLPLLPSHVPPQE